MAAQEDERRGFLKAPLIQKIVNTMWFANKTDEAVVFAQYFKPFPFPALALVLTAVSSSHAHSIDADASWFVGRVLHR